MSAVRVECRRWFQKSCGNTYHSVRVNQNGVQLGIKPFSYGYGNQCLQTGAALLKELGLAKPSEHDWTITDVQRKKDL